MTAIQSLGQLERLVRAVPFSCFVADAEGRLVVTSESFVAQCGRSEALADAVGLHHEVEALLSKALDDLGTVVHYPGVVAFSGAQPNLVLSLVAELVEGEKVVCGWVARQQGEYDTEWLVNQIAHALRNPIFAASVQAEALSLRVAQQTNLTKPVGVLLKQLKRLEGAIDEMLLFGRPAKLQPRKTSVARLLEEIVTAYQQGTRREPAQVHLALEQPQSEVCWDCRGVTIVLERLLDNAVEHTDPPHSIELEAVRHDQHWTLTVRDHGEGVAQDLLSKLFLPFYPQHRGRPGLGLAIARKYARALGGSVEVRTQPGRGTEVCFTLGVHAPPADVA